MGRSGGVANVRGEVAFVAQQVLGDVDVDVEGDDNDDEEDHQGVGEGDAEGRDGDQEEGGDPHHLDRHPLHRVRAEK